MTSRDEENILVIKQYLSCPICDCYMSQSIPMCKNGHSICNQCFVKLRKCPTCRAPKSDARCFTLESIASKLSLPCRYTSLGCRYINIGPEITSHESHCKFAPICCPFRTYDNCSWQGYISKLKHHCQKKHRNNFYLKERQRFLAKNFKSIRCYHYIYVLICAYDEFFRLTWEMDTASDLTRWAVYYMGPKSEAKKYSYKLEFPTERDNEFDDISRNMIWKSPCGIMPENDSDKFVGHNYLILHKEFLETYCEANGDLNYTLNVYRSSYVDSSDSDIARDLKESASETHAHTDGIDTINDKGDESVKKLDLE